MVSIPHLPLTSQTPELEKLGDLGKLGGGKIAYIRTISSEDVSRLFPEVPSITPGLNLFALLSADGTPLMLTDRFESACANAWENELQTVSVH